MIRLQDGGESELGFQMKPPSMGSRLDREAGEGWLKFRGYTEPCFLIVGFEGEEKPVEATRRAALGILKRHGGFSLGKSVARRGRRTSSTFRICATTSWTMAAWPMWPRLRPYGRRCCRFMPHGRGCEGALPAGRWNGLHRLPYLPYLQDGACLYFTFAARQPEGREIEHYYEYKRLVTDAIMRLAARSAIITPLEPSIAPG